MTLNVSRWRRGNLVLLAPSQHLVYHTYAALHQDSHCSSSLTLLQALTMVCRHRVNHTRMHMHSILSNPIGVTRKSLFDMSA